jgi:hypothetical protein
MFGAPSRNQTGEPSLIRDDHLTRTFTCSMYTDNCAMSGRLSDGLYLEHQSSAHNQSFLMSKEIVKSSAIIKWTGLCNREEEAALFNYPIYPLCLFPFYQVRRSRHLIYEYPIFFSFLFQTITIFELFREFGTINLAKIKKILKILNMS